MIDGLLSALHIFLFYYYDNLLRTEKSYALYFKLEEKVFLGAFF